MVTVSFLSIVVLGPALALAGKVRPSASSQAVRNGDVSNPISRGLRFSLYGALPINVGAERKDWDLDGWGEAAFVYLRLLGWLGAGAAGVAIGLRVRRWE